jgi:hypothetical protein
VEQTDRTGIDRTQIERTRTQIERTQTILFQATRENAVPAENAPEKNSGRSEKNTEREVLTTDPAFTKETKAATKVATLD